MATMTGSTGATVRTTSGNETISETVIAAVADAKGVDPLDLDPLYDSIDPDALDSIFAGGNGASSTELSFVMGDVEVLVRGGGEVVVTPSAQVSERAERVASLE